MSSQGTDESPDAGTYRQLRFRRPPGACELLLVRHGESAPRARTTRSRWWTGTATPRSTRRPA